MSPKEEKCSICFCIISNRKNVVKPCNCTYGIFHQNCIKQWIKISNKTRCDVCLQDYEHIKIKKDECKYFFLIIGALLFYIISLFLMTSVITVTVVSLIIISVRFICNFIGYMLFDIYPNEIATIINVTYFVVLYIYRKQLSNIIKKYEHLTSEVVFA